MTFAIAPSNFLSVALDAPDTGEFGRALDTGSLTAVDWVVAASVLVGGYGLSLLFRRGVVRLLRRGTSSESFAEVLIGRLTQVVIITVALVYALGALGVQFAPLLGALGIGGLAVALALQPTLQNLFSGLMLHAQRPIRVGEEIVTGEVRGEVVDITSRSVVIRRNSGEMSYIPNSMVLDREIENLVRNGRRRTTVTVGVAYSTDLAHARRVLLEAVTTAPGVFESPRPKVLASSFGDSSVDFDVDFWHGGTDAARRAARAGVIEAVHRSLGDADIAIPFPQRTLWSGERVQTEAEQGSTDGVT